MKKRTLYAFAALTGVTLGLCAQALLSPYSLSNAGIAFSDARGFVALTDDAADNSRFAVVSGPDGENSFTSSGVTPYYVWAHGRVGETQNIPYLRPDGTVGTLEVSGGIIVGQLNGNVPTPAPAVERDQARAAAMSLLRRGFLRPR